MIGDKTILDLTCGHQTPFYLYDIPLLEATLATAKKAMDGRDDFKLHYAVKANTCPTILETVRQYGFGADTVSGGEVECALRAGFPARRIMFAGVGKTDAEIRLALRKGIGCLNVESVEELEVVNKIAASMDVTAPVALRIYPDIDAHTHHYITTGVAENKFGIDISRARRAVDTATAMDHINFRGLHFHIGSQITDLYPYEVLCTRAIQLVDSLEADGIRCQVVNFGGGLGVDYDNPAQHPVPPFQEYFDIFKRLTPKVEGRTYHFELGRALVAQCGSLITRVLFVKQGLDRRFVIADAGMTELIRPALYQALHRIDNISANVAERGAAQPYDIVGPVCESSDIFATEYPLPPTQRDDILAIRSAGAYGEIMASNYNCRTLAPSLFYTEHP